MRFLICGLGSIGQRHFRNLKALGHDQIAVYRTGKGANNAFVGKFLEEHKPEEFSDLSCALNGWKPDAVLVTNPTSLHVPVALEAARAGCHLLIEKPLWHQNGTELSELLRVVDEKKLVAAVAYHWRFNQCLGMLRAWLAEKEMSKPISVRAFVGEQVSGWHSWEDHRDSYACRADLGGGVVLTLSHDIDMLYWLFGKPESVSAVGGNFVHRDLDVEDTAEVGLRFKGGLVASLHMDYWQPEKKREIEISCADRLIEWGPTYLALSPYDDGPIREFGSHGNESDKYRNIMHTDTLRQFIGAIGGGPMGPLCDLWQASEVLDIALEARKQILPFIKKGEK